MKQREKMVLLLMAVLVAAIIPGISMAYTDSDGDGYFVDDPTPGMADCDDTDPGVHPGAFEVCDGKDTDCDGWQAFTDVDADGDGVARCANDCDDNNPSVYPGAPENLCNGIDDDCNGIKGPDERDFDGDGSLLCDPVPDCNDNDATIYPGNAETCGDMVDNNCNAQTDEGCTAPPGCDVDSDGYYNSGCGGSDCDDSDPNVYPGAQRICDGKDNDCDGWQDYFSDEDKDGDGVVWCAGDCNDNDPEMFPGNTEIPCDGKDNDCSGRPLLEEIDYDRDGVRACDPVPDCNDYDATRYPGNDEVCGNGIDEDCDNLADNADPEGCTPVTGCQDNDNDGIYGISCVSGTDCDDSDPNVYPGAQRICDGKDNNCDGRLDFTTDVDNDGDGIAWCEGDCDDSDPAVHPGATENLCNGKDDDCNGIKGPDERDYDRDGSLLCDPVPDCNDYDASIYPGNTETCGDMVDDNCNLQIDEGCTAPPGCDDDGDGYYDIDCGGSDCDDADPNVYPGAPRSCDGKDSNCDGRLDFTTDVDNDGDGVAWCANDCNDSNPSIYPGAPELCDGLDNDCNYSVPSNEKDNDADGVFQCGNPPDCDDNDPLTGACSISNISLTCPATLYRGEPGTCMASATSNGTIDYSWTTSGNITPSGGQADVYYATDGQKTVSVTASVTEYPSLTDTTSVNIDVHPLSAGLSCTNTNLNLGESTVCDATSAASALINDYVWSSGNSVTIDHQQGSSSATVTAVGAGTETIQVDLCMSTGYCETAVQDITINAPSISAEFSCPETVFKNQQNTCAVTASTSSGAYSLSYDWTSSGTITGNNENADVTFPTQGTHTVTVKVYLTDFPAIETTANATIEAIGYLRPAVTINGPSDVLVNSQQTYSAQVDSPSGPVDITWDVNGTVYHGDTVAIDFNDPVITTISVSARVQGSGSDADAVGTNQLRVVVHRPQINVYIKGDLKTLVSMPASYEAAVSIEDSPFYDQFQSELTGQWQLHDGSSSSNNPLEVTFQSAGTYTLTYRAWVRGYEDYDTVASVNVRAEEYTFGPFSIHSYSRSEGIVPFYASYAATGVIRGITATEAGVKYYWSFEGEQLAEGRNRASHVYQDTGSYTINLKVTDKFGNESTDSTAVTVSPPPPLTLALAAYYSNRSHYAPVKVAAYPRLSGGIRGDKLESYSWQINGVDVVPPPYMLIYPFDTPGTYTVNFSGQMSLSGETVSESFSFDVIENTGVGNSTYSTRGTMIMIQGNSKMLPNDDLNLTASIMQEGTQRNDGIIEWTTPQGTVSGSSLTMASHEVPEDGITLSVKGYLPEAPEKRYYNRIYVVRVLPAKPAIRILSAPRDAIVGQPVSFLASAKASSINAGREISTEWLLPDGSTVAGNSLSHTTSDTDFADNRMIVEFRAWVNGYKSESLNKVNVSVMKNPYLWPGSFSIEYSPTELYAPAGVTLKALPVSSTVSQYTLSKNITYNWNLPDGVTELLRRQNEIKVRVDLPGDYDLSVDLSDSLGNSASVPLTMNVLERIAAIDLLVSYDKEELIEPLRVSLRPRIVNLENDIVTEITYYEPITGQSLQGSYATMDFTEGQYAIEIKATTNNGKTINAIHNLTVGASTPPDCTIDYSISQSVKTVFLGTTCIDPDPKDGIVNYEWRVGSEIISYSYRAYYSYETSGPVNVELTVTDKAGKTATFVQPIDIP